MSTQQLQRILQALSLTQDDELTCAGLDEDRLAAYIDLELAGGDAAAHMPEVHRHLALCPDCRQEYQDVLATLRLERQGEWLEPGSEPAFDLSFLPHAPATWLQVAERIRRFATDIPALALHELDRLGRLPAGLQLAPAAAAPKMRGSEAGTPVIAFRLTDADEQFAVDLRFRRAGEDIVWINVQPFDARSRERLPGAFIQLRDEKGRLLEMRTVPAGGVVRLRDVPINQAFTLRIEHGERIWEIPFSLHIESPGESWPA